MTVSGADEETKAASPATWETGLVWTLAARSALFGRPTRPPHGPFHMRPGVWGTEFHMGPFPGVSPGPGTHLLTRPTRVEWGPLP